jgi:uncharacterized membrane protein
MTREAFIARLREGLRGLPPQAVADIVADYETHFADGEAAGRTEAEVATALGDPARLARELRAEIGLKRWEEERSASGAAAAVFAVLGLGALDLFILLPVLMTVGGVLFGLSMAAIAGLFAGGAMFAAGPFSDFPGGPAAAILGGLGVMSGATALGAVIALSAQ